MYDDLDNTLYALLHQRNALFEKVEENIVNAQQKQKVIFTAVFIYIYIPMYYTLFNHNIIGVL